MMTSIPWQSEEARWLTVLVCGFLLAAVAWLAFRLFDSVMARAAHKSATLQILRSTARKPMSLLPPLLALNVVIYGAPDTLTGVDMARKVLTVTLVVTITFLLIATVQGAGEIVIRRRPHDPKDNLAERRLQTQAKVMTRSVSGLIGFVGIAIALMTFPNVRHLGASLLASAGLAGIVAGLAARPVLGNMIAGLQIGFTQPIRLDDVVIVEGEYGNIEEITGTYVVVRLWDQRRLIVPLEWWTQNPFQNWTRSSSAITGTVFLWVDYRTPIDALRDELQRICKASPNWDGVACGLQVTDMSDKALQLRCLMTSPNSSMNWDLRCEVREKLLNFMQTRYPECLPRLRADVQDSTPSVPLRNGAHHAAPYQGGPQMRGGGDRQDGSSAMPS